MYVLASLRDHAPDVLNTGMSLGQRVRDLREKKGLSQTELAHAIGKQMLAVSQIERGNTVNPRSDTLAGLAEVLGTSVEYLLNGAEPETTYEPVYDEELSEIDRALLPFRAKLTPDLEAHIRRRHAEAMSFLDGGRMQTLVGFVEDEIVKWNSQQSKLREAPDVAVELPTDAMMVPGKKPKRG